MWFLIKCLLVFALFYVVATADERGKPAAAYGPQPNVAARRNQASGPEGVVKRLQGAARDSIVETARERCLEHPSECAKALQFAGDAALSAQRRR